MKQDTKEELEKQIERFKQLNKNSFDMIVLLDANGIQSYVSESCERILGYKPEELINISVIEEMIHQDDQALVLAGLTDILENSNNGGSQYRHRHKNGSWVYLEAFGTNQIHNPLIKSVVLNVRDITKSKQAEQALVESDSIRELLLDIITHDLKNPAGVIYALSEAARKDMPENKFMESIFSTSERLIEVINQTTILSQAAFGEIIPKEALSLKALIEETADEFASDLKVAEMDLVVAIDPYLTIKANPLIVEVFKNYISNAIKYARDGKRVVIETVVEDQAITIIVNDFGKTIPKKDRENIFERRIQLKNIKKRGRGLGLSIVKRIAGAHGGEVWVEPNKPRGNRFCLRIPL